MLFVLILGSTLFNVEFFKRPYSRTRLFDGGKKANNGVKRGNRAKNHPIGGGGLGSRAVKGSASVPSSLQSPSIHLFLRALRDTGYSPTLPTEELVVDKNNPYSGVWRLLKCPQS